MRVARQSLRPTFNGLNFLTIVQKILFLESPFKVSARIDTWCAMGLKKYQVAAMLSWLCATPRFKKMIEAGFEQVSSTSIAGDMPAELTIGLIGPHHHCQGIPTHDGGQAFLNGQVTRENGLLIYRDRIDVG